MENHVKWAGLEKKPYKDFGYANSWPNPPMEVKRCQDLGHQLEEEKDAAFSCVHIWSCPICKIQYKIDSSG
jgi:hypothetical protein